jgi:alkanesulfonate monooxygenase SsuD/methylene tetrahydromethanopterin reductase-like flavin-dependent oxidoreductase (luciferase family)
MRFGLMVEGQEGVTWEDWLALAEACERLGFEALFRSDHYLTDWGPPGSGSLDAWGPSARSRPAPRRCDWGRSCRR